MQTCHRLLLLLNLTNFTTVQKFGHRDNFFKEINTFIQQGHTELIKSEIKNMYNITTYLHFK